MKVIIDIPEKDYNKMCRGELVDTILVAIKNGIPLPDAVTNVDMLKNIFPKLFCGTKELAGMSLKEWLDAPYNQEKWTNFAEELKDVFEDEEEE